jgi:hypothetical protein
MRYMLLTVDLVFDHGQVADGLGHRMSPSGHLASMSRLGGRLKCQILRSKGGFVHDSVGCQGMRPYVTSTCGNGKNSQPQPTVLRK